MSIDLNADLGGGCGEWSREFESERVTLVTSVNIPGGAHLGDPSSMLDACGLAAAAGLPIAALVGYRDPFSRGERFIDYTKDDLTAELVYQLGALDGLALLEDVRVTRIRPAGALAEAVHTDRSHAWAVVEAVLEYDSSLAVVCLPGGTLFRTAERHGLTCLPEFHPHRVLTANGGLGSVRAEPARAADRAIAAARSGNYATIRLPEGPGLAECAEAVHRALRDDGHLAAPTQRPPN